MRTRRLARALVLCCAIAAVAACHHTTGAGSAATNVITSEELDSAGSASVYDVIVRAHALFLRDRGRTSVYGDTAPHAMVFIGETEYGDLGTLRNQPASRFSSVRYYTGTEAATKFGSRYAGGVIQLVPKS